MSNFSIKDCCLVTVSQTENIYYWIYTKATALEVIKILFWKRIKGIKDDLKFIITLFKEDSERKEILDKAKRYFLKHIEVTLSKNWRNSQSESWI